MSEQKQFQSQAGFVPLCDVVRGMVDGHDYLFQSQAGFVPLCDIKEGGKEAGARFVSIPGGICSSLRLRVVLRRRFLTICFNPRRDLFLFATILRPSSRRQSTAFQSQAGFVPLCDNKSCRCGKIYPSLFQSQAGFVPLCDTTPAAAPASGNRFQSQAGFVPLCDGAPRSQAHLSSGFQSQAGFVPLCDRDFSQRIIRSRQRFNPRRDLFLFATQRVEVEGDFVLRFNPRRDLFLFATLP